MKTFKNWPRIKTLLLLAAVFLFPVVFTSCEEEETPVGDIRVRNRANEELYKLMKDWYYWYDHIPSVNPSDFSNPAALLDGIRKMPEDRWSFVTSRQALEDYYIHSRMFGHGFASGYDADGNLRVIFLFRTSDLYASGVQRGWIIEKINNTDISPGMNIHTLLGPNQDGFPNAFTFNRPVGPDTTIISQKRELVMNNIIHSEVIDTVGKRIGYMVLNGFTTPTFDEIDSVFAYFYQHQVNDLILDLRYNGGGQTNVAFYLANRIAGNSVAGKVFAQFAYNEKKAALHNRTDSFTTVSQGLNLSRLITINTRSTASASEMVINGLSPFIDVVKIGDDTYGKPMGMNAWIFMEYAFVPITFKIKNSLGYGGFFDGLPVDFPAADDISRDFGDPLEASLNVALQYIVTGTVTKSKPVTRVPYKQPRDYMTGLDWLIGAH